LNDPNLAEQLDQVVRTVLDEIRSSPEDARVAA
jgi:hypothetical protein